MNTPQATPTAQTFVELLRKSGLIEKRALEAYLTAIANLDDLPAAELSAKMQADNLLTAFQANHLLKGRYKNFTIGKYRVLELLGTGGMSQVFLCEHMVMKHRVALKLLPIKESADPEAVSRFLREARAAAAVNHPNVVRAHDVDMAEGKFHYIVLDYVDGVNLHDLVKRIGVLPPEQAANYIAQAALGIQEIASKGLVHRDIKPSNLLLDRDGVIRILDLGLARFTADDKDNITQQFNSESVFGTADYLAPEQAMLLDSCDARSDLYSLGATLYYLLSGTAPFESANMAQKLLAHQMREPEPIPDVPAEMMAVLLKMMAKKPAERYQEAIDVCQALARWANVPLPMPEEDFFPRTASNSGPSSSGPRSGPPSTLNVGQTLTSGRFNRYTGPTSDILRDSTRGSGIASGSTLPTGATPPKSNAVIYAGVGLAFIVATIGLLFAVGVFAK